MAWGRVAATRRVLAGFIAALLMAGGAVGQEVSEQTDVERVVRTLAALEPRDLHGLESVLGPLGRDRTLREDAVGPLVRQRVSPGIGLVRVTFAVDPRRQDPQRVTNPPLASYEIVALVGRRAAADILRDQIGKPRKIRQENGPIFAHDRFYLEPLEDDRFRLLWYREEPDFAIPPRSRGEEERLTRDLVRLFESGFDRNHVERRLGRLDAEAGAVCEVVVEDSWSLEACPAGVEIFDRLTLRFRPALRAYELLQVLDIEDPVVVATDAHRTSRLVADPVRGFPTVGGYRVEIHAADRGLESSDRPGPGYAVWEPVEELVIEMLELTRRPRQ